MIHDSGTALQVHPPAGSIVQLGDGCRCIQGVLSAPPGARIAAQLGLQGFDTLPGEFMFLALRAPRATLQAKPWIASVVAQAQEPMDGLSHDMLIRHLCCQRR
jgi:hypothetical protein